MDKRELFVGAMVCAESPSGICKVKEIIDYYWVDTNGIRHDYELTEPIDLTPENLEKNGFKMEIITSAETNYDKKYYHWNPTPKYPSEGIWLRSLRDGFYYDDIHIRYFHELQTLLRLCGIDKEIALD